MDHFVYVIKSKRDKWFYTGLTRNLDKRLSQHNNGMVQSTKYYAPFLLVHVEITDSRESARNLEKLIKVRYNKEILLDIVVPGWRNW